MTDDKATTSNRYADDASSMPTERGSKVTLTQFRRSPRLAEIRAVYRTRTKPEERHSIREPGDAINYLRAIWNKRTIELSEDIIVLYLNASHQVIGWVAVASGGMNSCTLDQRIVLAIALQTASNAMILAHNHPSGSLQPSSEDKQLTARLKEAGHLLGIKLLDHIILTRESSFSFSEHGLL